MTTRDDDYSPEAINRTADAPADEQPEQPERLGSILPAVASHLTEARRVAKMEAEFHTKAGSAVPPVVAAVLSGEVTPADPLRDSRGRDRVALELMAQEFAPSPKTEAERYDTWSRLPDFDQSRYLERADKLVDAYLGRLR